ncbi:multicopper oxidase domain-containing protein [Actinocatenispora sera]|uniref:multicopper oxidase domain-containing protein n=1 Tax=Actinocatenispora sera TaxID=390989 RepID=UPI0034043072
MTSELPPAHDSAFDAGDTPPDAGDSAPGADDTAPGADDTAPGARETGAAPAGARAPDRGRGPLLVSLSIVGVLVLAAVLIGVVGRHSGDRRPATAGERRTVAVHLVDMDIVPATITLPRGTRLILRVTNSGAVRHDLAFPHGPATRMLNPGGTQRLDLGPVDAGETGWCTVPGHKQAGMTLTIRVSGHPATAAHDATIAPDAVPGHGFRARPAALPAAGPRVHRVTLAVRDRTLAVAPGVTQRMWTFGGTVPGPTLHGRVGDTFVVTLVNDADMGHSIDFHASSVAPDRSMRTIGPGQRLVYRFTAEHAGAFLYHCATAPMVQHIGNGMYGAIVIDPPDLRPVAAEYVLVGAELYLGPDGGTGDAAKMSRGTPDAVVFNGYYDQYRYAPLAAKADGRVRIWVVDAGLTRPIAFHVVGAQFDTVFGDGGYLVRPGERSRGAAQALALQPGQGGFVEFALPGPGHYPFLSHLMTDADRGATGTLVATR